MKTTQADQVVSRAVLMAGELAELLLGFIAQPSTFGFVSEIFSDGFAPSEIALIQQPAAAFGRRAGGAS